MLNSFLKLGILSLKKTDICRHIGIFNYRIFLINAVISNHPIDSADELAKANTIRCVAQIKRLSHPRQLSYAKESDKVIHINHDLSISVELEGLNIGDISSDIAIIEALIDVETRAELNHVTKQLNEAMKQNWYVIIDATYLCVSDTGAIMFGCTATITGQTEKELFALK